MERRPPSVPPAPNLPLHHWAAAAAEIGNCHCNDSTDVFLHSYHTPR